MHNSNLPLALTMGDPAGIGPEIIVKSINKLKMIKSNAFTIMSEIKKKPTISSRLF